MLKRIKKMVLTKTLIRHMRQGTKVLHMTYGTLTLFLSPGSNRVLCTFKGHGRVSEPLTPPKVSDYVVEHHDFDGFISELKARMM